MEQVVPDGLLPRFAAARGSDANGATTAGELHVQIVLALQRLFQLLHLHSCWHFAILYSLPMDLFRELREVSDAFDLLVLDIMKADINPTIAWAKTARSKREVKGTRVVKTYPELGGN